MPLILQIGVVFAVCLAGELISAVLPFAFPASVIGMLLLFLLLWARVLRPVQLAQLSGFLLDNMPLFFIPACVSILNYADALLANLLPILLICIGTVPLVFFVTGHTVQLAIRWVQRKEAAAMWREILDTVTAAPAFGLCLTIFSFLAGRWAQRKTGWVLAHPLLIASALCIAVLAGFGIPYENYARGGDVIHMMLGPVTALLALGIYNQKEVLGRYFAPVLLGCAAGSLTSIASVCGLCHLFGLDDAITAALLPKSCTTPIAIGIAESHGGITAIAAAAVFFAGTTGAICAPMMAKYLHVTDPVAQGLATGACSHALGTTKAREMGEVQGAMSSIAIGVCGLISVVIALFL